jgi:hypothetical protein
LTAAGHHAVNARTRSRSTIPKHLQTAVYTFSVNQADAMPATDANAPSTRPGAPSRPCDKCDADMTHLSDLQPMIGSAAMRIFRCYACNHVISEER